MTINRAALQAKLAEASSIWTAAKGDDDGIRQRRDADMMALKAVIDWARAELDIPAKHLEPLVSLAADLDDLNSGKLPTLMKRMAGRRAGNPGASTDRLMSLAIACAAVDVLSGGQNREITEIEREVARVIGMEVGKFQSRRKKLKSGKHGKQALVAYRAMRNEFQGLSRQQVFRTLEQKNWRALSESKSK